MHGLTVYNTLTRRKEVFSPIKPPFVGLYVCGPTVYGDAHLGHARAAVTFDVVYRYLTHLGYRVRYVRNITDVGHLENDADEGEDKIAKKARLEQREPMELAQLYTDRYHDDMARLNVLRPSIEPRATGHIPEQIAMIERILANGYAYVANGSVYFDVPKYAQDYAYGQLSGRSDIEALLAGSRDLDGQNEKRHPADFALWKQAAPQHIMKWQSPWGMGFPGWHIECSAMSTKYLGEQFDIHGGGLDLMFPHHEAEIAQSNAYLHPHPAQNEAKYWLHNNMITINGQKMGKSLGNFITLDELFAGNHTALDRSYPPMTIRFFILQAHYRSTLDFSNEALSAAEKGLKRLLGAIEVADRLKPSAVSTLKVAELEERLYAAMNDDLNTAITIAELFEAVRWVHAVHKGDEKLTVQDIERLKLLLHTFTFDILGMEPLGRNDSDALGAVLDVLIDLRADARKNKNFAVSDLIRDRLKAVGIILNDSAEGTFWQYDAAE